MAVSAIFKTLYGKLSAVLLGLLVLMGSSYVLLTLFSTRLYLQEIDQKLNQELAEHLVSEKILMTEGKINKAALEEIFHMLMVINPSIEVYLLDSKGSILEFSAPSGKVKRKRVAMDPLKRFIHGGIRFPVLGDDPRDPLREKIFSVSPIPPDSTEDPEGYLYVILGGEQYDSVAQMLRRSYILRLSTWAVVGSIGFSLIAGLFLFNLLTRRLRRLTAIMEHFRRSDFSQPFKGSGQPDNRPDGDEIDQLRTTFNQMAGRIIGQMDQLRQTDRLRRELVANVSHDLRTPLASLQGYLETLLIKEGKLSSSEQRNYLEIAVKHSERLGKLVGELFELAKLDSRETEPQVEPFSIAELVQDIVQKFNLAAENKSICLQADFSENVPFVTGDIGLIERVLENLIENALRFTPNGGKITVALTQQDHFVQTKVIDTGCGIPPEELPHIFERFYRVGKAQDKTVTGTGLGLAIAKRILDIHSSKIEAASTPHSGTTFTFLLPIHIYEPSGP